MKIFLFIDAFCLFAVPKLFTTSPSLSGTHSWFTLQNLFESMAFWNHSWGNVTPEVWIQLLLGTRRLTQWWDLPSFFSPHSQTEEWRSVKCVRSLSHQAVSSSFPGWLLFLIDTISHARLKGNPLISIYLVIFNNNFEYIQGKMGKGVNPFWYQSF